MMGKMPHVRNFSSRSYPPPTLLKPEARDTSGLSAEGWHPYDLPHAARLVTPRWLLARELHVPITNALSPIGFDRSYFSFFSCDGRDDYCGSSRAEAFWERLSNYTTMLVELYSVISFGPPV